MKTPPRWTTEQLDEEAKIAISLFRKERLEEPLEKWKETFTQFISEFEQLLETHGATDPSSLDYKSIEKIFGLGLGDAFRYLAGPPISADDLKVLAEASLAPSRIFADHSAAQRILEIVVQAFDPIRFPWVVEGRHPTKQEKSAAILASAALLTAQRVQTGRRNDSRSTQEGALKEYLKDMEFTEVAPRTIKTLDDAPDRGEFCGEALVGSRKADVSVRLHDGRLMPIECKVSNSSTNSVKRLNNDAQVKAGIWKKEFGTNQVVPAALLSGVFKVHNLVQAQDGGIATFWQHRLDELRVFIEGTISTT